MNCYERNLYRTNPRAKSSRLRSVRKWEFENAERKYEINAGYRKRKPGVAKRANKRHRRKVERITGTYHCNPFRKGTSVDWSGIFGTVCRNPYDLDGERVVNVLTASGEVFEAVPIARLQRLGFSIDDAILIKKVKKAAA